MFRGAVKKESGYCLTDINKAITYSSVMEDIVNTLKKLELSSKD